MGWISVENEFPDISAGETTSEYVLVYDKYLGFNIARYSKVPSERIGVWIRAFEGMSLNDITHWTPLVEPGAAD